MSRLIIRNASLLSFNDGFKTGNDTLAIESGRIIAVGRWNELEPLAEAGTELIDAGGKALLPGFNDSHIHIWKVGNLKTFMLDVRSAKSMEEMLDRIADYHRQNPHLNWITCRGFNEAGWKEGRMPDKNDLDKITTKKPIFLIRTCAHIAVANSKALELSAIDAHTPVPPGGLMQIGKDGIPNGIFSETALGLVSKHIPAYTKDELKIMIRAARQQFYSLGITAATDPAVDPLLLQAYHEMNLAGELGLRVNAIPILLPDGGESPFDLPEYFVSDWFNVNTVKFFSDGGLSGKTAALKRTYKNTSEHGVLRLQRAQYLELGRAALEKGLGLATHAIGDAAIEFVIGCYQELSKAFPGNIKRIEHLGLPEEKHLEAMAAAGIAASMQTIFISELGKNFRQYLDQQYLDHCYPVKSVLQHGILTALSSDAPVVSDLNPLKGIAAAVTRRDNEGFEIAPLEAISVKAALKGYTLSAAAISGNAKMGTLEPGQYADLVMLDKDPMQVDASGLSSIKVEKTYINGICVYQA